ncbi:MAG TPA: HAMP domain-containing sensor histidine kinase [Kineosporiaceae bacterium]|nr:HAMP domain-containing sensor histidine kinase [Kineosporiaceae bacterium]
MTRRARLPARPPVAQPLVAQPPARPLPARLYEGLRSRLRARTLHTRLARITALAVFVAVTMAGGLAFAVTFRLLMGQVDDELEAGPAAVAAQAARSGIPVTALELACTGLRAGRQDATAVLPLIGGSTTTIVELAGPGGDVCRPAQWRGTNVTNATRVGVVRAGHDQLSDARSSDGAHLRVLVAPLGHGWSLTVGRDLSGPIQVIRRLRGTLFGLSVLGALAALVAGSVVARAGLRPIGALADAAEHIARTQDLSIRIDVPRRSSTDEVTRLADAFDRMTAALSAARQRQAQLVADAGHELRTPLTSLRTNLDLLVRSEELGRPLPEAARRDLMTDVRSQLEELTQLVDEVVVLAQEDQPRVKEPVRLDEVVRRAVARVRPRSDRHTVATALEPWTVAAGDPAALERAVVNLLDNALKFSPLDSTVRVALTGGRLIVDDQGPGVPDGDRSHVFERFWRAPEARSVPGSGLGLAIVADVAAAHDGTVSLGDAPGGGTRVTLTLPGTGTLGR